MIEYEYLEHHGIKGQKWGVRRFQNKDGTRTPAGKKRYYESSKNSINTKVKNHIDNRKAKVAKRVEKENALAGYAQDVYERSNKVGKAINKLTDAHNFEAKILYDKATPEERKARADKYREDSKKLKKSDISIGKVIAAELAGVAIAKLIIDTDWSAKEMTKYDDNPGAPYYDIGNNPVTTVERYRSQNYRELSERR